MPERMTPGQDQQSIEKCYTPPIGLIVIDRGSPTIYTRQYNSGPCVPYAQSCISRRWKHKGPLHIASYME
jgi:hypothetical protein